MDDVVEFIDEALQIAKKAGKISGPKLVDFKKVLQENSEISEEIEKLRDEIQAYSKKFPMPGYEEY